VIVKREQGRTRARLPVIMYLAIKGNWGAHYDAAPPGTSLTDVTANFIYLGLMLQLLFWVPVTVIACGLLGVITAALRRHPAGPRWPLQNPPLVATKNSPTPKTS
jgi:hypothetical protein